MQFRDRYRSLLQQEKIASTGHETIQHETKLLHGSRYPVWYMLLRKFYWRK